MIQGTIVAYDPIARQGLIEVPGYGRVRARNALPRSIQPATSVVNAFLAPHEADTVMPSETFPTTSQVAVMLEGGDWVLLGLVIGQATLTPIGGRPGPGALDITRTVTTDGEGKAVLTEVAERAQINQAKVVAAGGGEFTAKIFNGEGILQASWGDGSVDLIDEFDDRAGFGFRSGDRAAHLVLLPVGTYTITLSGERFA